MIASPILLSAIAAFGAILTLPIRRWTRLVVPITAAISLLMGYLAWQSQTGSVSFWIGQFELTNTVTLIGRPLELAGWELQLIAVLSVAGVAAILVAGWTRPGDVFFPGILAILSTTSISLAFETLAFKVMLVEIVFVLTTMLLQGSKYGSVTGAWRFFVFHTLALPFLLIAAWHIDLFQFNPTQPDILEPAVILLSVGFLVYAASVPFHSWIVSVTKTAAAATQLIAFFFVPSLLIAVMLSAMNQYGWYGQSDLPYQWFTFLGIVTTALGGLLILSGRSVARIVAYSLIIDAGSVMMLMGTNSRLGHIGIWSQLLMRFVSLIFIVIGDHISNERRHIDIAPSRLSHILVTIGMLSLLGFPLTPGFSARWFSLGALGRVNLPSALTLLAASAIGWIVVIANSLKSFHKAHEEDKTRTQLTLGNRISIYVFVAANVVLALVPTPLLDVARKIALGIW
ncbi:MAG: proton-conducting transporter membrane subunit [Chloroflexota bacterium]